MILPYIEWDIISLLAVASCVFAFVAKCYYEICNELRDEIAQLKRQSPKGVVNASCDEDLVRENRELQKRLQRAEAEAKQNEVEVQVAKTKNKMLKNELNELKEKPKTSASPSGSPTESLSLDQVRNLIKDDSPKTGLKGVIIEKMKALVAEVDAAKQAAEDTKFKLAGKDEEITGWKRKVDELEKKLSEKSDSMHTPQIVEKSSNFEEMMKMKNDLKQAQMKCDEKNLEIRVLKNTAQEKNKKIEALNKELRETNFSNHDLMNKVREAEKIAKQNSPEDLRKLREQVKKLNEQLAKAKETEKEAEKNANKSLGPDLDEIRAENKALKEDCDVLKKEIESLEQELAFEKRSSRSHSDQLEVLREEISSKDSKLKDLERKLNDRDSEKTPPIQGNEEDKREIENLKRGLSSMKDELERKNQHIASLTRNNLDIDRENEIEYFQNRIDILEMDNESLQQNVIRLNSELSEAKNRIREGQIVPEEIVTVERSNDLQSSPSNTLEHTTSETMRNLEEKLREMTEELGLEKQRRDKDLKNFSEETLRQVSDLFASFGGDAKKIQGRSVHDAIEIVDGVLRFKIRKKDDMMRQLNAENEDLSQRLSDLNQQLLQERDLGSEVAECKAHITRLLNQLSDDEVDQTLSVPQLAEELSDLVSELISEERGKNSDLDQETTSLQINSLQNTTINLQKRIEKADEQIKKLEDTLENVKEEKSELAEILQKRDTEIQDLRTKAQSVSNSSDYDTEGQYAKGELISLLETNGIEFEPQAALSELLQLLYQEMTKEIDFQRNLNSEESRKNRDRLRRLEDKMDQMSEDSSTCRNVLRQILSKNEITYNNNATLEELVMRVKTMIERIQSPPIQSSSGRSRSLTKLLQKAKRKSKSKDSLRGSQMSLASSSYLSSAGSSDHLNEPGMMSDLSNISRLSSEQLKASLENLTSTEPHDFDEIKVSLFEILKMMNRAPDYPRPTVQMVQMIKEEVERRQDEAEKKSIQHEDDREVDKPEDSYNQALEETYSQVHRNLYNLLHESGFDPDPSINAVQLSETAVNVVSDKLKSLRKIGVDTEREKENLKLECDMLSHRLHELERRLDGGNVYQNLKQKEETDGDEQRALEEERDQLASERNELEMEKHEFDKEKRKLKKQLDNYDTLAAENKRLNNLLDIKNQGESSFTEEAFVKMFEAKDQELSDLEQQKNEEIQQLQGALDEAERKLEGFENEKKRVAKVSEQELDLMIHRVKELERENQKLKQKKPPALVIEEDFVQTTVQQTVQSSASDSVDKSELRNKIKVLEKQNQELTAQKAQKESELQEQVLSLIEQNTKLIENKKALRGEIKTLKQQLKEVQGSVKDAAQLRRDAEQHHESRDGEERMRLEQLLANEKKENQKLIEQLEGMQRNSAQRSASGDLENELDSTKRSLATANAKLTGQNEMIKRLQREAADGKSARETANELTLENQLLLKKLKENDAEDITSIRFSFSRLCEELEIKEENESLPLAEQMENVFDIIKKRFKGNQSMKRVRFNPQLTSVQEIDNKSTKSKNLFPTWPKGENAEAPGGETVTVDMKTFKSLEDHVQKLEKDLKASQKELKAKDGIIKDKDALILNMDGKIRGMPKLGSLPSQSDKIVKNAILQILNKVESPQDFRLMDKDSIDSETLLKRLDQSVKELIARKDRESLKLSDSNKDLSRKVTQLERDVHGLLSQEEPVVGGGGSQRRYHSKSTPDLSIETDF